MLFGNFNPYQEFMYFKKRNRFKSCFVLALLSLSLCGYSQTLEEKIYTATERFIAHKTTETFSQLLQDEILFTPQIKSRDEQLAMVFLLCNKGYYLNENNHLNEAISNYENAWKRYSNNHLETLSDYDIIEYCLKPLGNLYTQTNNFTSAESTIKQYILLAQKKQDEKQQAAGIINLAVLYQTLGKHQSVIALISSFKNHTGIDLSQKEKLLALEAKSCLALNMPVPQGLILNIDPPTIRQAAKTLVEESKVMLAQDSLEQASELLHHALKLLLPNNTQVLPDKSTLYAENTFLDIFDLLAFTQDNPEIALEYFDLSLHVSDLLMQNMTSQEAKIFLLNENRKRSEQCLALLYNLYQENPSKTRFKRALDYAEASKASILQETSLKKILLELHPNDSLLQKEQTLRIKQEKLTSTLVKQQLGYSSIKADSLDNRLLEVSIDLKKTQNQIAKKYPDNTSFDLATVQSRLQKDQATLLEYFYGKNSLYLFLISENETRFLKIDLTHQSKIIPEFIDWFNDASAINNQVEAFAVSAFNLYTFLKVNQASDSENLIIIPDGLLNFIPFESLLTQPTQSILYAQMPFLVNTQTLTYNSSITFYLNTSTQAFNKNTLGIFPVFEHTSQPLTFSLEEAKTLETHTNSSLFLKEKATKSKFLKEAHQYAILHLSTHATGGDFITPAAIAFHDEPMLLNELYSLDINPNLVVLSACETGIGKLYKGEGPMSLARGFQYAGAQNILFSLWQISDASTATFMDYFYTYYTQNTSVTVSNTLAKRSYLRDPSISHVKKSPYYWSAFVFYGIMTPEKKPQSTVYPVISILVLIILLLLFIKQHIAWKTKR